MKIKKILLLLLIWPLLGINRFIILFIPFRRIAPKMGQEMVAVDVTYTKQSINRSKVIGRLIISASKRTPWQSKCFVQALTGIELMWLFKLPYTLYFGIRRGDEAKRLEAHAWLKHGDLFVTGYAGHDLFHPVAWYGKVL